VPTAAKHQQPLESPPLSLLLPLAAIQINACARDHGCGIRHPVATSLLQHSQVPDDAQFNCMLTISQQTGARWIIGVNSYRNNMALTRAMTDKAKNILGSYFMGAEVRPAPAPVAHAAAAVTKSLMLLPSTTLAHCLPHDAASIQSCSTSTFEHGMACACQPPYDTSPPCSLPLVAPSLGMSPSTGQTAQELVAGTRLTSLCKARQPGQSGMTVWPGS
jgi:hypothetical protein